MKKTPGSPFLSIIMTNKNACKWLDRVFSSLEKQVFRNFELIFVDNRSTDDSIRFVSHKYPWAKIIKGKKDLGFSGGNNLGAARAKGEYLLLLNTDTYLNKDSLSILIDSIKKNGPNNIYQMDLRFYNKSNINGKALKLGIDRFGYPIGDSQFFYAEGSALAIKRTVFNELDGFDEKYYMYLEDVDLCWRARLMGIKVIFVPKAYVFHYGGGTSQMSTPQKGIKYKTTMSRRYHAQKNNIRSLIKNYSLANLLWSLPVSLLLASMEGWIYLAKGSLTGFIALHKAILWNIINIKSALVLRHNIQKKRIVADNEILKLCDKRISKFQSLKLYGVPKMT